jgi:1A family penicillin-binding protein
MAEKKRKKKKRIIYRCVLLVLGICVLLGLIYVIPKAVRVNALYKEAESYVSASSANTFKETKTTIIYDINDNQLCTMKNTKDLYYVTYQEIPATLVNAFVVMEDRNYYSHSGIDLKAIIRAIVVNQQSNEIAQGASTITQQLARNIFLSQEVTWERKVEEIFIAMKLEEKYSKTQILEFYLNNIYFGNGYYGVEAAARGYFDKSVSELKLEEQAFIAAIPNNPTRYNPLTQYDNTVSRKNLILQEMEENGYISSLDCYIAQSEEVVLNPHTSEEISSSVMTYIRHCATESMMQALGFTFRNNFSSEDEYNVYADSYDSFYTLCQQKLLSGGYTIYTSIDMAVQEKLQTAVDNNLASYTEKSDDGVYSLQGAATCIDNSTGNVVAIVGSRSQEEITGEVLNRAFQSYRQPGSSIKPLNVYTPFLQLGNTPDTVVEDTMSENGPVNADGSYSGQITLREAVRTSKNTVAWNIYQQLTPKTGSSFLIKMGFHKIWVDRDYNAGALGGFTYGVTTEEMAAAYSTLENDGIYRKATCIRMIVDSAGKRIVDETTRGEKVYEKNATQFMTQMLREVVLNGTGTAANIENGIVAGKTGTTNSTKDVWFCGYSKYYTTTVWAGYDYPREMSGNISYCVNSVFRDFMTEIHTTLPIVEITGTSAEVQQETTAAVTEEESTEESTQNTETLEEETTTAVERVTTESVTGSLPSSQTSQAQRTTSAQQPATRTMQYGDIDATTRTDADSTIKGGDW